MTNNNLSFFVHNQSLAPAYALPALEAYQAQKNIQVISNSNPLAFGDQRARKGQTADQNNSTHPSSQSACTAFFSLRLEMALGFETSQRPNYFPGAVIPGPGGATCKEVERGNLLFDQFRYLLAIDGESVNRLVRGGENTGAENQGWGKNTRDEVANDASRLPHLFCLEQSSAEAWLWKHVEQPTLYFLHQAPHLQESDNATVEQALEILAASASTLLDAVRKDAYGPTSVESLLSVISRAWFSSSSGLPPVAWGEAALARAASALKQHDSAIDQANILPFLFELEAMTSYLSLGEARQDRESFARGIFAGNYIEVAMSSITSIKPTEFCVRDRLFDEVVNLTSRGFAPVVVNEYGLVADGNHRLTAAYIWNILKYCQDLEWSLDNVEFQHRASAFAGAVANGLLGRQSQLSPITLHEVLHHLSYFLCRPDWRGRLHSYTRPLLKRHDFIKELPVVVLPEYLSGAVVKSLYDDGERIERACPSMYEAVSLNNKLVLPPRASYHFTDAALLPWFTVLKSCTGTRHRPSSFGRRSRAVPR